MKPRILYLYIESMVTAAVGKELQSTVKTQRREPLVLPRVVRNESHGGGDIWVEPQRISRLSTKGLPVRGSSIRKNIGSMLFGEHWVIWCGWILGKIVGDGGGGGQVGDTWKTVCHAKGKQPMLAVCFYFLLKEKT